MGSASYAFAGGLYRGNNSAMLMLLESITGKVAGVRVSSSHVPAVSGQQAGAASSRGARRSMSRSLSGRESIYVEDPYSISEVPER